MFIGIALTVISRYEMMGVWLKSIPIEEKVPFMLHMLYRGNGDLATQGARVSAAMILT